MAGALFALAAPAVSVHGQPAPAPTAASRNAQPGPPAQPGPAASGGQPLNIPPDVSFVGPQQSTVARATAIVNDEIITQTDVDQRLAALVASQRVQLPPEEIQRFRAQVLRNLIDETLEIQAAHENQITIEQREIDRYFARYSQNFGQSAESFAQYLRSIGSSDRSIKRQIQGELAWQQLQRAKLTRVSPSNQEVEVILARLNATRGSSEYHVAEIYLSSTPERAAEVRENAARMVQQIRAGASFPAYARQYSEATTAALGGDLGWIRAEQLPPELGSVVQAMPVGSISDPIQVSGGFSVVALIDSRQVLVANPRDAQLSLMQMSIALPAGTNEAQARQRAQQLAQATQAMGGCRGAAQAATTLGAELVSNDGMRIRDLPPQLQQTMMNLSPGQATPPFGTLERISVLVLCGRDDPPATRTPTAEDIQDQLAEDRMNRQAQRYLRDLRRDAVIEYR
jgi:peptidyl-prolyl cis-trans isomerase SurA